ncbi:gas vesicle protein GvpG [Patescibacteria group bacterium]|nr:gas vesicle protein GvpG [Patescibacteria group bacterium]
MFLIDDILLAPLKGVIWIAQKLDDMAQKELTDTDNIKEKLMALQLKYELDEISEEEYNEEEKKLLMRLDIILKQEKEKGNG